MLLALAANTSFGGLPVLASLLAKDNFLPHMFALRADRQVYRYGVVVLAVFAAALLVASKGNTQALIPLFAVGVFVGFTLSQFGMVKHWRIERSRGWMTRAVINGLGAVLTTVTTIIELVSKFTEGAWLIVIVIPGLVLLFSRVHRTYDRIGALLGIGQTPKPPSKQKSLVVVPVASLSRLTAEGISAALSLGDEVIAVTVCYADPEDEAADVSFRHMGGMAPERPAGHAAQRAPLDRPPIVKYLCQIEEEENPHRRVVLIPEVQPKTVLVPAVQPARRDPGPGDQAGHRQRGDLPAPVPAGAVRPQRGRSRGRGPGPAARFRGAGAGGPPRRRWRSSRRPRRRPGTRTG